MPTFATRSGILAAVLRFKGWEVAADGMRPDFGFGQPGRIRNLSLQQAGKLTSKKAFTRLLRHSTYLPASYTSSNQVPVDGQQVWFIKGNNGASQQQVFAVRTRAELQAKAQELGSYIVQQGITALNLYHGYKYTTRAYLLLLKDGRAFFHRRMLASIHEAPYDPTSTTHESQVGCDSLTQPSRLELRKIHPQYDLLVEKTLPAMREVATAYQHALQFGKAEYHLFGVDLGSVGHHLRQDLL